MGRHSDLRQRLQRFFSAKGFAVVSAYLFGSEAQGTAHRESDIDVGVFLDYASHDSARSRFERRLELGSGLIEALHRNEVDVVVLNDAPPLLARRIVQEGDRVWCRDAEADRGLRRDVMLRAADLAPFLRKFERRKLEALGHVSSGGPFSRQELNER